MPKEFQVHYLNNNVPVLLANYPDSLTFTMGVSFNVGGRNEWQLGGSYNGISHFLEHQFFKGNEKHSPFDINKALDSLGGTSNAFTTRFATCYFTKSLASEAYNSISLWNTLLDYGKISQEEFEKEAFVVRQEFRNRQDNPVAYLFDQLEMKLFKNTSLEMNVIGTEESLSKVTLEQMEAFRDQYYDMNNAVILVLGDLTKIKVIPNLNATFGNRKTGTQKPKYQLTTYSKPTDAEFRYYRYEKTTPLAIFGISIKTPGGRSNQYPALQILMNHLSLGNSAFVHEYLVRSGVASFAYAFDSLYEDVGSLNIIVGVPPNQLVRAHDATLTLLFELSRITVTSDFLAEICDRTEYAWRIAYEEPMTVMYNQALDYWVFGEFVPFEKTIERLRNVTPDDFQSLCQDLFTNINGVYLVMGAEDSFKPSFPNSTWKGEFRTTSIEE